MKSNTMPLINIMPHTFGGLAWYGVKFEAMRKTFGNEWESFERKQEHKE